GVVPSMEVMWAGDATTRCTRGNTFYCNTKPEGIGVQFFRWRVIRYFSASDLALASGQRGMAFCNALIVASPFSPGKDLSTGVAILMTASAASALRSS